MDRFFTWVLMILRDQRGSFGEGDSDDDTSDDDDKSQADADTKDEKEEDFDDDDFTIDLDEKEEDEDEEAKKKAAEAKAKTSEEEAKKLRSEVETFKEKEKEWKRDMYQARKDREEKRGPEDKDAKPLSDAQLTKLLDDAETDGDSTVKLNVLKYMAQQIAKGEATKIVNTAEMGRKSDGFKKTLEDRFPDITDPTSDMRADINSAKEELGIVDHPYGDMFAVGFKLFQDMDDMIDASFEAGKEEGLKGVADEKRKKEIKAKSLPSSTRSPYKKTHGLTASQLETATLMGLDKDQLPAYAKLVGKKPRTVSVEG